MIDFNNLPNGTWIKLRGGGVGQHSMGKVTYGRNVADLHEWDEDGYHFNDSDLDILEITVGPAPVDLSQVPMSALLDEFARRVGYHVVVVSAENEEINTTEKTQST